MAQLEDTPKLHFRNSPCMAATHTPCLSSFPPPVTIQPERQTVIRNALEPKFGTIVDILASCDQLPRFLNSKIIKNMSNQNSIIISCTMHLCFISIPANEQSYNCLHS